jgi:hypothetical protein
MPAALGCSAKQALSGPGWFTAAAALMLMHPEPLSCGGYARLPENWAPQAITVGLPEVPSAEGGPLVSVCLYRWLVSILQSAGCGGTRQIT